MENSPKIKRYVLYLISSFLILSLITSIFFLYTFNRLKINGDIYTRIKQYKNLKVDIFPPKLYIVEIYRLIQQNALSEDINTLNKNIALTEEKINEYFHFYNFWKGNVFADDLYSLLITDSHEIVLEFLDTYYEKILPRLQNHNFKDARSLINKELNIIFLLHKQKIDEASKLIDIKTKNVELYSEENSNLYTFILIIIYAITFFITLFISVILFKKIKTIEKRILDSNNETEILNTILNESYTKLNYFRHSFENNLASIIGFSKNRDLTGLNDYLAQLNTEKKEFDTLQYENLSKIKNNGLVGLIASKINLSKSLNVELKLNIYSSINTINIKSYHLTQVLGIILDNAIEEAKKDSPRNVFLKIIQQDTQTVIEVINSLHSSIDKTSIFKQGFSTKGKNRGHGLFIAKKIISSYPNVILNTFIEKSTFIQELIILDDN